ncbi:MAG: hypothetical protein AAF337_02045, partial [Pseudomonadota bacterium]
DATITADKDRERRGNASSSSGKLGKATVWVDFEFKNRLFERVVGGLFSEAVRRMVSAFEKEAHVRYADAKVEPKPKARRRSTASSAA